MRNKQQHERRSCGVQEVGWLTLACLHGLRGCIMPRSVASYVRVSRAGLTADGVQHGTVGALHPLSVHPLTSTFDER